MTLKLEAKIRTTRKRFLAISENEVREIIATFLVDHVGIEVKPDDIGFPSLYEGSTAEVHISWEEKEE